MYFSDMIKQQLKHDAPYAWFLKDHAKLSPLFRKKDIELLDEKLEGYIDCFVLSKKADDDILDMLKLDDWGAVYVMARVALEYNDDKAFETAVEAVKSREQTKELAEALSLFSYPKIEEKLYQLITNQNPLIRTASIYVLDILKIKIEPNLIYKLLQDDEIEVKIATIKLIGSHRLKEYTKEVEEYLKSEDEELRFESAYTGCLLKSKESIFTLREFCFTQTPYLREALALLYYTLDDTKVYSLFQKIATKEFSPRIKAYNFAMSGFALESVPILLEKSKEFEKSLFSAEAISFITGIDLDEEDLTREENLTQEEEKLLLDSQKADEETQDYEEDLPLPDSELLIKWWQKEQKRYKPKTRYLAGREINIENLQIVIEKGTQPQIKLAKLILELRYNQKVNLSNQLFSLDSKEKKEEKKNIKITYSPKTGDYIATLPKGHPQTDNLKIEPFAYGFFREGEAFNYFGLEDYDVGEIVWVFE